jgi:hypothetical protein
MNPVRDEEHLGTGRSIAPLVSTSDDLPLATPERQKAPSVLAKRLSTGLTQYAARGLQRVGKTGAGGIGLMVFAVAFFLGANVSLKSSTEELQASLDASRGARLSRSNPQQARASTAREVMRELPTREALPAITRKIVAQAEAAGIALDRGNYDFTVTHSGKLVRARMTFPVHGRYPDIRRFIDSTLLAVPGAAVDGLRLERKDIGAGEIDADIRFAVYVRGTP